MLVRKMPRAVGTATGLQDRVVAGQARNKAILAFPPSSVKPKHPRSHPDGQQVADGVVTLRRLLPGTDRAVTVGAKRQSVSAQESGSGEESGVPWGIVTLPRLLGDRLRLCVGRTLGRVHGVRGLRVLCYPAPDYNLSWVRKRE